jgi:hypothetical protein
MGGGQVQRSRIWVDAAAGEGVAVGGHECYAWHGYAWHGGAVRDI